MTTPGESAQDLDAEYNLGFYGDHRNGKQEEPEPLRLKVYNLKDIAPQPITWLWPRRFPTGKFCMLAGDPGLGKSYLTLDIAARVSLGGMWPDGGPVNIGNVLIISVEDGMADTIVPRLILLDADLARIRCIGATVENNVETKSFNLQDHLQLLEDQILEFKATLLILDPVLAFTGNKDTHKSSDVRAVMAPLAEMADATQCTILSIIHLNKKSGEFNSIYRLTGSLDFAAAARSVMVVGKHPDIEGRRVFAPVKMNLSAMPPAMEYSFTDDGIFAWGQETTLEANDILSVPINPEDKSTREQIKDFLLDLLQDGPMYAKDIWRAVDDHGFAKNTVRRAADDIGVQTWQNKGKAGAKGSPGWTWGLLPPDDSEYVGT